MNNKQEDKERIKEHSDIKWFIQIFITTFILSIIFCLLIFLSGIYEAIKVIINIATTHISIALYGISVWTVITPSNILFISTFIQIPIGIP